MNRRPPGQLSLSESFRGLSGTRLSHLAGAPLKQAAAADNPLLFSAN